MDICVRPDPALSSRATAANGQTVFPGAEWKSDKPETQSMSSEGLEKVGAWLKANGAA